MVDATDLKSVGALAPCGFESHSRYKRVGVKEPVLGGRKVETASGAQRDYGRILASGASIH